MKNILDTVLVLIAIGAIGTVATDRQVAATLAGVGSAGSTEAAETPRTAETAEAVAPAEAPSAPAEPAETDSPAASAPAQEPDAETVLRRVAAAYENVRGLRAGFVQELENTLLGSTATSRGTIYQRRPDRFLMRFTEPAGDVIVGDGEHFWIYYPSIDENQVIRSPMGAGGAGGVDLQAQFVGNPLERFDATLEGTEPVDGRKTYVLTLDPKRPLGYDRLKVWVDAEDHIVRRFTITEPNGVVRRIRLNDLEVNPTLADSLFRFEPPAGATIVDRG